MYGRSKVRTIASSAIVLIYAISSLLHSLICYRWVGSLICSLRFHMLYSKRLERFVVKFAMESTYFLDYSRTMQNVLKLIHFWRHGYLHLKSSRTSRFGVEKASSHVLGRLRNPSVPKWLPQEVLTVAQTVDTAWATVREKIKRKKKSMDLSAGQNVSGVIAEPLQRDAESIWCVSVLLSDSELIMI